MGNLLRYALLGVLIMHRSVSAEPLYPVPIAIPGVTTVDAEGIIELAEMVQGLKIIDSRISSDRGHGYIEGSSSLPNVNTTCSSLATVIPSLSTPTLFYCNGLKCGRSADAIAVAKTCGYNDIYWFRGGFEEWLAAGFPFLKE